MLDRDHLTGYIDGLLNVHNIPDGSWNGLQVEGKKQIENVAVTVDAGEETFSRAAENGVDFLIVHHGLFWKSNDPRLKGWMKRRIGILIEAGISLYAAHLPLDLHPQLGNNAQLIGLIGARTTESFAEYHGLKIGWMGTFAKAVMLDAIVDKLEKQLPTACKVLPFGPAKVETVGAVSGGGGMSSLNQAVDAGVDLYISGEPVESYHLARDAGVNIVYCGHHASETVGVKALGREVEKQYKVAVEYIDVPTGL